MLAALLAEHGVRHVFGVPGGQTLALYDAILDREPGPTVASQTPARPVTLA